MSRTKKGKKGPGFEYWGRRPGGNQGMTPGPGAKKITHKIERQQNKKIARDSKDGD